MRLLPSLEIAPAEIIREVEVELESHIQERADRLEESGMTPREARDKAEELFGDRGHYLLESAAIVLASRLHRAHRQRSRRLAALAAGVTLMASLAGTGAFIVHQERVADRSLAAVETELGTYRGGGGIPLAQEVRFVTVRGKVGNPRVWTLPRTAHVTLREIIYKSGGLIDGAQGQVTLTRYSAGRAQQDVEFSRKDWDSTHGDVELSGFATIEVH